MYCAAERNRNVDVCRYINSKDIRDYLRSIHYQFTPIEAAWLISYCRELTLQEKHAAWQELIDTMPDCPIAKRRWTAACPSLHAFLREYIRFQDDLVAELYSRKENEIYAGKIWRPQKEEIYPFSSVESCLAECRDDFDGMDTPSYSVVKYQVDEPFAYIIGAEFRADDGALMTLYHGSSVGKAFERTIFEGSFLHFPVPFKRGDIVWNPNLSRDNCECGPFVFKAAGVDAYEDHSTKDKILGDGDYTDMCASGYVDCQDGTIIDTFYSAYMDLEYYTGSCDEPDKRLISALSDCLKEEANEQEFWSDLPETDRQGILESFFLSSHTMREYLLNAKIHKAQVLEMILGAPVPLTVKQEWLSKLSNKEPAVFRDALLLEQLEEKTSDDLQVMIRRLYEKSFTAALEDVEEALEQTKLYDGGILYLKEYWYEDDLKGEKSSGTAPFLSLSKALEYIRHDLKECDYNPGDTIWYVLEKWSLDDDGEMEHRYTYYLIGDEIVWFEKRKRDKHDRCCWLPQSYDYSSESRNLDLPVPFEVGDIVLVDCTPFRPIKAAVIIEAGEGVMLQALVQNEDGKWRTGAVRNTSLFSDYPLVSSLYRMALLKTHEESGLLDEVADALVGKPERGAALWNMINGKRQSPGNLTANEIRKTLEEMQKDIQKTI